MSGDDDVGFLKGDSCRALRANDGYAQSRLLQHQGVIRAVSSRNNRIRAQISMYSSLASACFDGDADRGQFQLLIDASCRPWVSAVIRWTSSFVPSSASSSFVPSISCPSFAIVPFTSSTRCWNWNVL